MTALTDPEVQALLSAPNHAVLSTQNGDGNILSTVVWAGLRDETLFVNSAVGRRWPTNLAHDPHATLVVFDPENPYRFLEVRGTVTGSTEQGTEDINWLSHKYLGRDYPFMQPGEERITFVFDPSRVRYVRQD
jgi:PPOX class probable F420-dependent enzyme